MSVKRFRVPSKIKSPCDRYEIAWMVKLQLQAPDGKVHETCNNTCTHTQLRPRNW